MKKQGKIQPQFYYEWGNEKSGFVSTGAYVNDVFISTGQHPKHGINLPYNCPFS